MLMNHIDIIDNYVGLDSISDQEAMEKIIKGMKHDQVFEFVSKLHRSLPRTQRGSSPYRIFGGSEMSGLGLGCSSHTCRSRSIVNAAAFASFFCDELILYDPTTSMIDFTKSDFKNIRGSPKDLAFYLRELAMLTPLINRGIITFTDYTIVTICYNCLLEVLKETSQFDSSHVYASALEYQIDHSKVFYDGDRGKEKVLRVEFQNPTLHDHDKMYFHRKNIDAVRNPKIGQKFTKNQVMKLGVFTRTAELFANDLIQKQLDMKTNQVTSSFSTTAEANILLDTFGQANVKKKFDLEFPLISSRNIESLLKIRDQEWHHFGEYRDFLVNYEGSEKDLKTEMEREIRKLELIFEKSRRVAGRKIIDNSAITVLSLASYFLSGGISAALSTATSILGAGHFAKKMVPAIRERASEPEELRESQMYFAWKSIRSIRN
jgi:hypothetical protein